MNAHLSQTEEQALAALHAALHERYGDLIREVALFGSKARGDDHYTSDIDVLVVVDSDDWQLHKEISYLVTDIGLTYEVYNISPRIWSTTHLNRMAAIEAALYRQIQQDSIPLAM
jgi:predicted nucleotidyltransferase